MFDEVTAVVNVRTDQFELGMFELVCNRSCIAEQRISLARRWARDTSITAALPSRQHAINSLQILRLLRIPGQTAPHAMTSTTQCSHFPFSVEGIERISNWRTIDDRREVAISQLLRRAVTSPPTSVTESNQPTHLWKKLAIWSQLPQFSRRSPGSQTTTWVRCVAPRFGQWASSDEAIGHVLA